MPPDPTPTRRRLVDSALRLYAERGVTAVAMSDITRDAGQRNNTALTYHFGGRLGILRTILEEFVPRLRTRRLELLGLAAAGDPGDPIPAVEALVVPVAELLEGGWRERAYLQIHFELTSDPSWSTDELVDLLGRAGAAEVLAVLRQRCPHVPDEVRTARSFMLTAFISQSCAARARALDTGRRPHENTLSHAAFTGNLVAMTAAALLAAPPEPADA